MNRTSQIWDSFNFGENGCLIIYLCIIFQHAVKDSIPNKVDGRVSNTCNCMVNWIIGWQRKNAFMVITGLLTFYLCIGCDTGLWSNGMGMYKASDNIYISWSMWLIDKKTTCYTVCWRHMTFRS